MTQNRKSHHPAAPLTRAHMPGDYAISLERYTDDFKVRIPQDKGPRQPMLGFEDQYLNIIDYIVRITHHIWEDREPAYIRETYAPDSRVYDDYGLQIGNEIIVENTERTLGAYSDMVLNAEECIWAGDDEIGYHTSHRVPMSGTNDGPGDYGPATGRKVDYLVIANCVSKENDIFLEHVLYNTSAMLMQLGLDPKEEARRLAQDPPRGWPRDKKTWDALRREGGPRLPLCEAEPVTGFDPDQFARDLHHALWGEGDERAVARYYDPAVMFHGGSLREFHGSEHYWPMVDELRSQLAEIAFQVDEVYWMGNDAEGIRIATRWSMEALHGAGGLYGEPTNASLQIWGITQQNVEDGRVTAEWMLFNEFDVMMQIAAARKDA